MAPRNQGNDASAIQDGVAGAFADELVGVAPLLPGLPHKEDVEDDQVVVVEEIMQQLLEAGSDSDVLGALALGPLVGQQDGPIDDEPQPQHQRGDAEAEDGIAHQVTFFSQVSLGGNSELHPNNGWLTEVPVVQFTAAFRLPAHTASSTTKRAAISSSRYQAQTLKKESWFYLDSTCGA